MIKNEIEPQTWVNLLRQASGSQDSTHLYLVSTYEGRSYALMNKDELNRENDRIHKLSLNEIVNTTKDIFERAQREYETHTSDLNARQLINLTKQAIDHTEKLITARESKRNGSMKMLARGVAWTLAGAANMTGYGTSMYQNMQQSYTSFNHENDRLREVLHSLQWTKVAKRLEKVPLVIADARKEIDLNDLSEFIKLQINKSIQNEDPSICSSIFALDLSRGVTFLRTDPFNHIQDKMPVPSKNLPSSQLIESGVQAISEMTQLPQDKRWERILQVAASQTSLTALFDNLKGSFVSKITSDPWYENEKWMSLTFDFSLDLPSIRIEIIRDPRINEIKKILVEIQGSGDIIKGDQGQIEGRELIAPQAIMGRLSYAITLTDDNQPIISDLMVNLSSHL